MPRQRWEDLSEDQFNDLRQMVADLDSPMPRNLRADLLRDPLFNMRAFARVKNFKGQEDEANFENVDPNLREAVRTFVEDAPNDDEDTQWVCELKYRQAARSTNYELGALGLAMYRPGWFHACIADTDDRANELHKRIHYAYDRWPDAIKTPNYSAKEMSQLTLDGKVGGTMRVLSAASAAAGIGLSLDSLHASECGYWHTHNDPDMVWSELYPALAARPHARVVFECTPTEQDSWWHQFCIDAKEGTGRFRYFFTPFYISNITKKKWDPAVQGAPELEELRLLEEYGPKGLTLEHLAFRRQSLRNVPEFKRNPEAFKRAYPFDDITCWQAKSSAVIPMDRLERFSRAVLVPWKGPYAEYEAPDPNASYIIGVDPVGFAARDHGAFHIWMANRGSERQVASFADHIDPNRMGARLAEVGRRYNNALIVIEANGVGTATLAVLQQHGYPNLYYRDRDQPGWNNNPKTIDEYTGFLLEFLAEESFTIRDQNLVDQLATYRHDKKIEDSDKSEQQAAERRAKKRRGGAKRERHHWDKVSALLSVVVGLRSRLWPSINGKVNKAEQATRVSRPPGMEGRMTFEERQQAYAEILAAAARRERNHSRRGWSRSRH